GMEAGRAELDRLTARAVHQGLALRIAPYVYAHPADLTAGAAARGEPPLIVALDGVTDPRNLGAIARSAAAFGGHGVLIPARRSARVTAGAGEGAGGGAAPGAGAAGPGPGRARARPPRRGPLRGGPAVGGGAGDGGAGGGGRAGGTRGRVRGARAVPAGGAALRRAGPDPDGGRGRVAQRRGGGRHSAV